MQNVLRAAAADKRWNSQSQSDVKTDKTGGKYNFAGIATVKTEEKHQFYPIPNKELSISTKLEQNKWWKQGRKTSNLTVFYQQ